MSFIQYFSVVPENDSGIDATQTSDFLGLVYIAASITPLK